MRKELIGATFTIPMVFLLLFLYGYPFVWDIVTSFYKWNILHSSEKVFVGFWNYNFILTWGIYWRTLMNSLYFTAMTVLLQFVIGLLQALLLIRLPGKVRTIVTTLYLWPLVTASAISALLWQWMFSPYYGPINYVIGKTILWLSDPNLALTSIIIADAWHMAPWWTLVFLAALLAIPPDLTEAIRMDGASSWQEFRYLIIPHLKPFIFIAFVIRTIDSFTKVFDVVYVLTGGGPGMSTMVIPMLIFTTALQNFRWGESATMSTLTIITSALLLIIYIKALKQRK